MFDRLTASAKLLNIRQVKACTGTSVTTREDAGDVSIDLRHGISGDIDDTALFRIRTKLFLDILRAEEEANNSDPVVWIHASYELTYELPGQEKGISEHELEVFGSGTAMFNVWPYFREFVQASLFRMDLPQVTLPLLRVRPAAEDLPREERKRA